MNEALSSSSQPINAEDIEAVPAQANMTRAQMTVGELDISFLTDPRFNAKESVLPLRFIEGTLGYLADPSVDLSQPGAWPPAPWRRDRGITDLFDRVKFSYDPSLDTDPTITELEIRMARVARKLPNTSESLHNWQRTLRVCHRLRIDELESGESSRERNKYWMEIFAKLDTQIPDELRGL